MADEASKAKRSKFPGQFWLVVVFEFFERGSYYGMMSILSVYMVDVLGFAKQDVGLIKGTIQPLLYFLPILSGALADRFGYRRVLMIAFSLLGGGYFLTSQATGYAPVFLALVVMGLGAGTFKPIISGTIARVTDESNSTLGFGIFYWSINLGAFLFPLFLVPFLRDNIGWEWVIIAAAVGTGAMLFPTALVFREPPMPEETSSKEKPNLLQTLANAFEIVYSPLILLNAWMRRSAAGVVLAVVVLAGCLGYGTIDYVSPQGASQTKVAREYKFGWGNLRARGQPNLCKAKPYAVKFACDELGSPAETPPSVLDPLRIVEMLNRMTCAKPRLIVSFFSPDKLDDYAGTLLQDLRGIRFLHDITEDDLRRWRDEAVARTILEVQFGYADGRAFDIQEQEGGRYRLTIKDVEAYKENRDRIVDRLAAHPRLSVFGPSDIDDLAGKGSKHPFLLVFVGLLLAGSLFAVRYAPRYQAGTHRAKNMTMLGTTAVLFALFWLLPGLSIFARILCSVVGLTLLSIYTFDYSEIDRFKDHLRFLLMVVIYSGFWVLYFQMFDSVLWYVQAYVDPSDLNEAINGFFAMLGLEVNWRFDIEIVTVINAGTIILLQLLVSSIVKNTKALPTMIVGIAMGTAGMAILAISTGIWVFMLGIVIFSVGEMTAHPKFISYVGQTAPKSRVAMYMGYLFLYGVIGSSIGGPLGANLYVKFVEEMNQPRTLWLIFASIGVATIIGLVLYNKFMGKDDKAEANQTE